jgi:hypothetical protein
MGQILRIEEFIPLTISQSVYLQVAKETKEGKDGHMPPHPVVSKLPEYLHHIANLNIE